MTREERLAALLAQPEGTVAMPEQLPAGLLQTVTPSELNRMAQGAIATQAAGEALRQARHQQELSLRQAGTASGRSAPRVKAIEDTDIDIHLGTVVEHAQALGYQVTLTLSPTAGGRAIEAHLTPPPRRSPQDATLKGETRVKLRAAARVAR